MAKGYSHQERARIIATALAGLRNALVDRGFSANDALRYARTALDARRGVRLGAHGQITYQGQHYTPQAFAQSRLADIVTGHQAEAQNQAAIQGDPTYLQNLAVLQQQHDLALSGVDAQRSQAVIDYGDPAYAGQDATLAGQAGANPFSIVQQLRLRDLQQHQAVTQATNLQGTLFGGGYQSGQQEAARQNAAGVSDAVRSLQGLLSGLDQQRAGAESGLSLGRNDALLEATQRLMQGGFIHAAHAPSLRNAGSYLYSPRPVFPHPPAPPHAGAPPAHFGPGGRLPYRTWRAPPVRIP